MIGKTVSHYKILEKLGEGGMGVVYKAEDTKLDRHVAIKFLPPHLQADEKARTRFIHEAKAASSLEHPHICAIHEINETPEGQTFIVMPCYKGETLQERLERGPLEIDEALEIASEVASALSKAHDAGMIHRDIKPGNIFVTADGVVKIMDFGLAKLAGQTKVTRTGMTLGTVAYMSPEQARGEEIDHRTDIWSLGVVLYEMLTGQQPFRGEYEPAVIYSIMNENPEPVTSTRGDVPIGLEDIVEKALAKDPVKRYQTMDELLTDLETQRDHITLGIKERRFTVMRKFRRRKRLSVGVAAVVVIALAIVLIRVFYSPGTGIDSLAVLPFTNLSGDEAQEYFSDGMTESLINEVGQIGALRVISRTSVMQFKQTDKTLPEIARELNVDAVVEASVLRTGDRIRITAKLYRAEPEEPLWSETYNCEGRDVAILLSEVTRAIADRIEVALTPQEEERLTRVRTVDPEAHNAYLKGRFYMNKWDEEGYRRALQYFREAIDIDPTYAQAYAGLARSYAEISFNAWMSPEEAAPKAKAAARKALELDDKQAEAYATLAWIKLTFDWDWYGPEKDYLHAVDLDPNDADIQAWFGGYLALTCRYDEAIARQKKAIELDPLTPSKTINLGWNYWAAGRHDESIEALQKAIEMLPDSPFPHMELAWNYSAKGMHPEAVAACDSAFVLNRGAKDEVLCSSCAEAYAAAGEYDKALAMRDTIAMYMEHAYVDPFYVATIHKALGQIDEMFEWLEKGYDIRSPSMVFLKMSFSEYSDDPRYVDLCRRIGIPSDD